jgi:hypothetical protein
VSLVHQHKDVLPRVDFLGNQAVSQLD